MEGVEGSRLPYGGKRNAGFQVGLADSGTGQGNERSHEGPRVTPLEKLEEEIKKIKKRIKEIEKSLEEKEHDFDKWEGTDPD